jgi:hypothetical protein
MNDSLKDSEDRLRKVVESDPDLELVGISVEEYEEDGFVSLDVKIELDSSSGSDFRVK